MILSTWKLMQAYQNFIFNYKTITNKNLMIIVYINCNVCGILFEDIKSLHLLVSITSISSMNFNAADIISAIVCFGVWCFNLVPCNQPKSMHRCIGKSCLSMVHHKARYWRPILHKSLIIRLRSYRREKLCVKNIFPRERHDSNVHDRKLSEAALQ